MKNITADGAYKNMLKEAAFWCGIDVEVSQKPESAQGLYHKKTDATMELVSRA